MLLWTTAWAVSPPGPPATGPGSPSYDHADVAVVRYGTGADRYWLYTPTSPRPDTAPVVVYLHGYGRQAPVRYHDLLTHLARRGYSVVFPAQGGRLAVERYPENTRAALADAFDRLDGAALPDPEGVVFVGHSLGGMLAVRLAVEADQARTPLPVPEALVLHDPAGRRFVDWVDAAGALPPDVALVMLSVSDTLGTDNDAAQPLWDRTADLSRRAFLVVPSDAHGTPPLTSDHLGVQAGSACLGETRPLDGIDWWGYWRPTELALSEILDGIVPDVGSVFCPDCPGVIDRGRWSDGTPVAPLIRRP